MSSRAAAGLLALLLLGCEGSINNDDVAVAVTDLVSRSSAGVQGTLVSQDPAISADGRFVAFASASSNLVAGDANGTEDVFRFDALTRTLSLVSVAAGGGTGAGSSTGPSISADGRYVAFHSFADDLVAADGNGLQDVFVRDLALGVTIRVSELPANATASDFSSNPSISADGRFVAFESMAVDLVGGDTNALSDVFRAGPLDWATPSPGPIVRMSLTFADAEATGGAAGSTNPSLSADGTVVAFVSDCTDLVAADGNGLLDVFVRDLNVAAPRTVRVSEALGGGDASGDSQAPSLSGNGRRVAFHSAAYDLVAGDTNGAVDVFVFDRDDLLMRRASLNSQGGQTPVFNDSTLPALSADGRWVAFQSAADNLVPGDTNQALDVFVRDLDGGSTERVSLSSGGLETVLFSFSDSAAVSQGGRFVAFSSTANNLVAGDANGDRDVFVRGPLR
jgi:Tol biopolymer transport system component